MPNCQRRGSISVKMKLVECRLPVPSSQGAIHTRITWGWVLIGSGLLTARAGAGRGLATTVVPVPPGAVGGLPLLWRLPVTVSVCSVAW